MLNRSFAPLLLFLFPHASLSQTNNKCTLDHTKVQQQDSLEVSATFRSALASNFDGYYNLNFANGTISNVKDVKAWCVDLGRRIRKGNYNVDVYSSMDPAVFDIYNTNILANNSVVDRPENLPAINWLLNEYPSESMITIANCTGNDHKITDQEFQLAVWTVIDDEPNPEEEWTKNNYKQCVVDYLASQALKNIDYVLDCSDKKTVLGVFIIVDSDENDKIEQQVLIAELNLFADTTVCSCNGGAGGDPHIKSWTGEYYDFHGVCDLILVNNPGFGNGLGMDIHMRTARMRVWSYISNAAIRIGVDILEVRGGNHKNFFWINGVSGSQEEIGTNEGNDEMTLATSLSGHPINFKQISSKHREFAIDIGSNEKIIINMWNSFVGVHIHNSRYEHFKESVGLMGSYPSGIRLARDNKTILDDLNEFGQEWQVLSSEPKLFHKIEGPQFPDRCEIPSSSEMRRRLGESKVSLEDAKKACANVNEETVDLCVFDVMATNDKSTVGAY